MVASYPTLEVYCCYDLADLDFYQAFKKHLAPLIHRGWIHLRDEQQILPGQEIVQERERYLRSADLLLLLISPDFLASETNQHQMSIALEMHRSEKTVTLPILLRPCRWQETILSTFQMLPREQKALSTQPNLDEAWEGIVTEVSHVVEMRRQWVFVVSAPPDWAFVEQLRRDMASNHLALWNQKSERASSDLGWDTDVRDAMRSSFAVVVVASPDACTSRMVKAQLDLAADYRRPIIVIWTRGEDWEASNPGRWRREEVLDIRTERYEATKALLLERLQQSRRTLIPPQKHLLQEPRNPYKGLQAFGEKDARDFFGRATLIDEMATVVEKIFAQEKKERRSSRLLTVLGASGSGKSSVVMAGLLPCLQQGGVFNSQEWIYLDPMKPGAYPLEALAVSLSQQSPLRDISSLSNALASDSVRTLHLLIRQLAGFSQKKVLLIIDQFEEVFTLTVTEEERQHFFDLLITAITEQEGSLLVILTLRADFYERPMQYPAFYRLLDTHRISILPMEREDLRQVIEQPASLPDVQLTFEGDLVGDLLYEMRGQVGALPLLEFTLDQLFLHRNGHQLTLQSYRDIGGVKGGLTRHAENTYAVLPSEEHRKMARVLFLRLIDPGISEQDTTRRRAAPSEFSLVDTRQTDILRETIDAFIIARLLTANTTVDATTIEVSHEALIREWPRLADWLATNRNDILLQRDLSTDVAEWLRRNCPTDRLYHGSQLVEALAWARRNEPSRDETAFLQASEAERERQETAEYERQAKELELQRRATRRQRYIIGLMGMTSIIVVVALIVGLVLQTQLLNSQAQLFKSRPVNVTNLNDSGSGSLRDAIQSASPGDTITFAKNLRGTIFLTHGALELSKNITLSGPSDQNIALDARHMSRIFIVDQGVTAIISNLTITNGSATKDATVSSLGAGGGIFADTNSTLVLVGSQITHNTAYNMGSGIFSDGELSVSNSIIASNSVTRKSDLSQEGNTITLSTHQTSNNLSIGFSNGGSIANYSLYGELSISNSRIENNTASGFETTGGIYSLGSLTLTKSTVLNNSGDWGGGIVAMGSTSISNCLIKGNKGNNGSGGIVSFGDITIHNSTIANNIATTTGPQNISPSLRGGGIGNGGTLYLVNSTISGNKTDANGGGIDNAGSMSIDYSTIYNNSAMEGGGIANEGAWLYWRGITNSSTPNYEITTSIIAGNQAVNSPDIAGSVTLSYPNLIQNPSGAIISFDQSNKQPITSPIIGESPRLAPLQTDASHPDAPPTHALLPGSPAIDQVSPGDQCNPQYDSDERGVSRPQGKGCDLGAYEYVPTT